MAGVHTCMLQQMLPLVLHAHLVKKYLPSSQPHSMYNLLVLLALNKLYIE